jgi:AcrR family transcriptional regulator
MATMTAKTKKEVVSEFRTGEILDAARRVFAAKGFHDATLDDVAEAARIAKGTIYLYYPSKQDLYWAALRAGIVAMVEEAARQMAAGSTAAEKIRAFIASKIHYFEARKDFFKVYFAEFGNALTHPAEMQREFKQLYLRQAQVLAEVIAEGVRRKELRPLRPQSSALAIADLTRGIVVQRLVGWSKAPAEDDIQFAFDLIWKGLAHR